MSQSAEVKRLVACGWQDRGGRFVLRRRAGKPRASELLPTRGHKSESLNLRYARTAKKTWGEIQTAAIHVAMRVIGQYFLDMPPQRTTSGPTTHRIATHVISSKSFSRLNWNGRVTGF
jgi:hypothetical protein